ncbi:hypothetical protein [Olleya sp. HaHaR_3_96]|uniref:hypothetical protein n=1 Tax=Olleya sp. HaHaR_3_96 TaxID=2745560 RepID=UPI001C4E2F8B|nr:hypothetical protein [Olleya sp. HaHaR_3_96]QXP60512.1 hypothetical protein H0I26_02380 [Olleya sp. HaHaR_3_96]
MDLQSLKRLFLISYIELKSKENHFFNLLKSAVETAFLENNSTSTPIKDWKGEEIVVFQDDLFNKVKGKVSEKWFYTYIKNTSEKLPRIDVLNLLSNYVGHTNWNTFKANHKTIEHGLDIKQKKKVSKLWLLVLLPIIGIVYNFKTENTFEFCFIDAIKNENITSIPLDIIVLQDNQSPIYYKTDSLGCFSFKTPQEVMRFVVQSPYHKTDTIVRHINSNANQIVKVAPDDYALMIHYYANGNVKDWKQHIEELTMLIAQEAKIYRLFKNNMDIELYSKDEFIRMLTIPTKSLKRTEILAKEIKNGKIVTLKFIVK